MGHLYTIWFCDKNFGPEPGKIFGFLNFSKKKGKERNESGQNSEKLRMKENVLAPMLSEIHHFEETCFFSIFSRKSLLFKKPYRICIIDEPTPKLSADALK